MSYMLGYIIYQHNPNRITNPDLSSVGRAFDCRSYHDFDTIGYQNVAGSIPAGRI
jgi:hypothetical protein